MLKCNPDELYHGKQTLWTLTRLLLREHSDLGPYCLQHRPPKHISRRKQRTILPWIAVKRFNLCPAEPGFSKVKFHGILSLLSIPQISQKFSHDYCLSNIHFHKIEAFKEINAFKFRFCIYKGSYKYHPVHLEHENIRIYHEYEGGIEKFVWGSPIGIKKLADFSIPSSHE